VLANGTYEPRSGKKRCVPPIAVLTDEGVLDVDGRFVMRPHRFPLLPDAEARKINLGNLSQGENGRTNAARASHASREVTRRRLKFVTIRARLGPYEIVSPIGAGSMGEIYKARDTRLQRDSMAARCPCGRRLSTRFKSLEVGLRHGTHMSSRAPYGGRFFWLPFHSLRWLSTALSVFGGNCRRFILSWLSTARAFRLARRHFH
jgi:hypothetical protein